MTDEQREEAAAPARPPLRTPRQIESAIEQRIREATEQGVFDHLPTHGKPLRLNLKDAINPEAWFVNHTMASLGAVPAWMELGKEIDVDDERLRWMANDFRRWLGEIHTDLLPLSQPDRNRRLADIELRFEDRFVRYTRLAEELKTKLDRFNLEVPVRTLERSGIWVAHELRRLREPYEALREQLGWEGDDEIEEPASPPADEPFGTPLVWGEERGGHRLLSLRRRMRGA